MTYVHKVQVQAHTYVCIRRFKVSTVLLYTVKMHHKSVSIHKPTAKGVPHKVQVQAATVVGLGESRDVEEVLFSEEQGTVSVL